MMWILERKQAVLQEKMSQIGEPRVAQLQNIKIKLPALKQIMNSHAKKNQFSHRAYSGLNNKEFNYVIITEASIGDQNRSMD